MSVRVFIYVIFQVKLYKNSQRESPVQTVTLTNSPFAYFNPIPFDNEVSEMCSR